MLIANIESFQISITKILERLLNVKRRVNYAMRKCRLQIYKHVMSYILANIGYACLVNQCACIFHSNDKDIRE